MGVPVYNSLYGDFPFSKTTITFFCCKISPVGFAEKTFILMTPTKGIIMLKHIAYGVLIGMIVQPINLSLRIYAHKHNIPLK